MLNFNDITFNKRLGNLIGRSFEMPYVSYCQPDGANPVSKLTGSLQNNAIFSIVMAAIAALFIRKKEKINDVVM